LEILSRHPQVEVFRRRFDTHARQWKFRLDQISEGWFSLDADYLITDRLQQAIARFIDSDFSIMLANPNSLPLLRVGRPLSGTVLPPRIALFRTK